MRDQQLQKMKGISEQAKKEILELLAQVKAQGERAIDFTSWDEEGVVNWLQWNGWHQFAEKFRQAKITGLSLIFLTESDLEHNIGIAAFGTRKKISKELDALRSRNPTALDKFGAPLYLFLHLLPFFFFFVLSSPQKNLTNLRTGSP